MSQNLFDTQLPIKCHVAAVDVLNEHHLCSVRFQEFFFTTLTKEHFEFWTESGRQ